MIFDSIIVPSPLVFHISLSLEGEGGRRPGEGEFQRFDLSVRRGGHLPMPGEKNKEKAKRRGLG